MSSLSGKAGTSDRCDGCPAGHLCFCLVATEPNLLTPAARSAIANAAVVYLSPISFYEITQKVRLGKWAAMPPLAPYLSAFPYIGRVTMAALDGAVCTAAGSLVWAHRDPFDRMIAATALRLGCPIVSSDAAFDGIVTRIW